MYVNSLVPVIEFSKDPSFFQNIDVCKAPSFRRLKTWAQKRCLINFICIQLVQLVLRLIELFHLQLCSHLSKFKKGTWTFSILFYKCALCTLMALKGHQPFFIIHTLKQLCFTSPALQRIPSAIL